MTTPAFVVAQSVVIKRAPAGMSDKWGVRYFARIAARPDAYGEGGFHTIALNRHEETREFRTFKAAEKAVLDYNFPPVHASRATWDKVALAWEVTAWE